MLALRPLLVLRVLVAMAGHVLFLLLLVQVRDLVLVVGVRPRLLLSVVESLLFVGVLCSRVGELAALRSLAADEERA